MSSARKSQGDVPGGMSMLMHASHARAYAAIATKHAENPRNMTCFWKRSRQSYVSYKYWASWWEKSAVDVNWRFFFFYLCTRIMLFAYDFGNLRLKLFFLEAKIDKTLREPDYCPIGPSQGRPERKNLIFCTDSLQFCSIEHGVRSKRKKNAATTRLSVCSKYWWENVKSHAVVLRAPQTIFTA